MYRSFNAFACFSVLITVIIVAFWRLTCKDDLSFFDADEVKKVAFTFYNENSNMGVWASANNTINAAYYTNAKDKVEQFVMSLVGKANWTTYEMAAFEVLKERVNKSNALVVKTTWMPV